MPPSSLSMPGLPAFMLLALLLAMAPGPNQVCLLGRTLAHGMGAGLVTLLGMAGAVLLHALAAAAGLTAALAATQHGLTILRWAGVACLLWMAFRSLARPPQWELAAEPKPWADTLVFVRKKQHRGTALGIHPSTPSATSRLGAAGRRANVTRACQTQVAAQGGAEWFATGFLVNALNPLVAVFFVTVLPQFTVLSGARHGPTASANLTFLLGMLYAAISLAVNLGVTLGAAQFGPWLQQHPCRLQGLRWLSALALLALAARLALAPL
jgi:threonine/homoserine/homoserine lactone efflux protein